MPLPIWQKRSTAHYCTAAPVHIPDYVYQSLRDTIGGKNNNLKEQQSYRPHARRVLDLGFSMMPTSRESCTQGLAHYRGVESDSQLNVLDSLPSTQYPARIPTDCGRDKSCYNSSVFQLGPISQPKNLGAWACESVTTCQVVAGKFKVRPSLRRNLSMVRRTIWSNNNRPK